jgi:ABC-type multidrug transport system fused ATPase/permease subunit
MISILLAVLLPVIIGLSFISLFPQEKENISPLEGLAVSYLLGAGILTFEMFLLGAFGIKLTTFNIIFASAVAVAYPLYRRVKAGSINLKPYALFSPASFKWYDWAFISLITVRVMFVTFECLIKPVLACDAFCNWSLRAKMFFYEQGLGVGSNYAFGGGQPYYPLNVPLLETWFFSAMGAWDDRTVKIIFALFFISLLGVFYCSVRRFASRSLAIFSTYLVTTLPMLVYHSTIEYSDFPLSVYVTAAFLSLMNYFGSKDKKHLYISAILAGIGSWTKSEGLMYMLIIILLLCLYDYINYKKNPSRCLPDVLVYCGLALVFKISWQIFNIVNKMPKSVWQTIEYNKIFENLPRIPVIIDNFYKKMFFYGNWEIAWFVFFAVLLMAFTCLKRTRNAFSLMMVGLCTSAIAFLYYITPSYVWLLDGTTLNRNIMAVMPLVIYFIAAQLSCAFNADNGKD